MYTVTNSCIDHSMVLCLPSSVMLLQLKIFFQLSKIRQWSRGLSKSVCLSLLSSTVEQDSILILHLLLTTHMPYPFLKCVYIFHTFSCLPITFSLHPSSHSWEQWSAHHHCSHSEWHQPFGQNPDGLGSGAEKQCFEAAASHHGVQSRLRKCRKNPPKHAHRPAGKFCNYIHTSLHLPGSSAWYFSLMIMSHLVLHSHKFFLQWKNTIYIQTFFASVSDFQQECLCDVLLCLKISEFVWSVLQLDVVSTLYHQESVDDDEFFEEGASESDDGVSPKEVSSS